MKRFARRTAAVTLGLVLGWVAAGSIPALLPGRTMAADENATANEAESVHGRSHTGPLEHPLGPLPRESAASPGPEHEAHEEHGQEAAPLLRPLASDMAWYRPVLAAAGGLFALAIVVSWAYKGLGIPTTPLPDPVAHTVAEEEHGHDAQGHAH